MMRREVVWKGIFNQSLERCEITYCNGYIEIISAVLGVLDNDAFSLDYRVKLTSSWQTLSLEIDFKCADLDKIISFESDGNGHWFKDGNPIAEFDRCFDFDISLTPFSNSLPINRLAFADGEQMLIDVLYFDLHEGKLSRKSQHYTKTDANVYHYENIPNDFEADIVVDDDGLVVSYPGLFERILR